MMQGGLAAHETHGRRAALVHTAPPPRAPCPSPCDYLVSPDSPACILFPMSQPRNPLPSPTAPSPPSYSLRVHQPQLVHVRHSLQQLPPEILWRGEEVAGGYIHDSSRRGGGRETHRAGGMQKERKTALLRAPPTPPLPPLPPLPPHPLISPPFPPPSPPSSPAPRPAGRACSRSCACSQTGSAPASQTPARRRVSGHMRV